MAAKDYIITTGWRNAYLSKKKKAKSLTMSTDRRVIEDNEILGLFEFYLRKRCAELENNTVVIINGEVKPLFEATLLDKEE